MNTFFQVILSNILFASILAGCAFVVERFWKKPMVAYILWVLVFIKLISPSFVPLFTYTDFLSNVSVSPSVVDGSNAVIPSASFATAIPSVMTANEVATGWNSLAFWTWLGEGFCVIWILGSIFFFVRSIIQVYRFNRMLRQETKEPVPELNLLAERLRKQLGIKRRVRIRVTLARLSPLVWWAGGRVQIIVPQTLIENMGMEELRWVLCHELAHVRRRDYWVRWLEWGSFICFWWNPLVWWGKEHLRANEEICCDELVLSTMKGNPYHYANSLLSAVEQLTTSIVRAPVIASEMNSGGFLERRLRMIVSGSLYSTSRFQRICAVLLAVSVLPLLACNVKEQSVLAATDLEKPDVAGTLLVIDENETMDKTVDVSSVAVKSDLAKFQDIISSVVSNAVNVDPLQIEMLLKTHEMALNANSIVFTNIQITPLPSPQLSCDQVVAQLQSELERMVTHIQKGKIDFDKRQLELEKQIEFVYEKTKIELERALRAQGLSDEVISKALQGMASNNLTTVQIVIDPQKGVYSLTQG